MGARSGGFEFTRISRSYASRTGSPRLRWSAIRPWTERLGSSWPLRQRSRGAKNASARKAPWRTRRAALVAPTTRPPPRAASIASRPALPQVQAARPVSPLAAWRRHAPTLPVWPQGSPDACSLREHALELAISPAPPVARWRAAALRAATATIRVWTRAAECAARRARSLVTTRSAVTRTRCASVTARVVPRTRCQPREFAVPSQTPPHRCPATISAVRPTRCARTA